MFDIGSSELLLIIIVAVIVIGPKDLPRALYKLGQIIGKAQGVARHFRTGLDAMVREVELEELEKKWATENKRIMAEHPVDTLPPPETDPATQIVHDPYATTREEEAAMAMARLANDIAPEPSAPPRVIQAPETLPEIAAAVPVSPAMQDIVAEPAAVSKATSDPGTLPEIASEAGMARTNRSPQLPLDLPSAQERSA